MSKEEECPYCLREYATQLAYDMQRCTYCHDFAVGDPAHKVSGYKWPGIIVADFETLAKKRRLVVECTVPEVDGALHIYSPEQIRKTV